MGPSTRHLNELIAQKDEEIKSLDSRCSAYLAKISLLQIRLQRNLDTLDEVQNAHAEETVSLNMTIKHLKERLRRCTDIAESAEMERDDMRDAVLRLVEKVETSNDYSRWPHSQIHLSILSDPLAHPIAIESSSIKDQEDGVLSYATSIIEELRRERDAEKVSHARTRAVAEAKILDLEAKLSRREAELESCVGHVDQDQDVTFTPKTFNRNVQGEPITSQQIISILDVTVARNKILELEIKALLQQLDKARLGGPSSDLRSRTRTPIRVQDPAPLDTSNAFERLPGQDESHDQSPLGPSVTDVDLPLESDRSILEDLEHQIRDLGQKIDAFRDERRVLLNDLSGTSQINPNPNTQLERSPTNSIQHRLMFLEREYDRLRQTEEDLRYELDATRAQSQLREEELVNQVNTIRADLQAATTKMNEQKEPDVETGNVSDLLEPSDGELSMELATPLMPVSTITVHPSTTAYQVLSSPPPDTGENDERRSDEYQHVDSPSLPLPPSPESPSDPISSLGQPEGLKDGLLHLENELVDTQRELEAGEAALDQLEELIGELRP